VVDVDEQVRRPSIAHCVSKPNCNRIALQCNEAPLRCPCAFGLQCPKQIHKFIFVQHLFVASQFRPSLTSSPLMHDTDEHVSPIGNHLVHIDGDTLVLTARGVVTVDDMWELLDHQVRIKRNCGMVFVIYNGLQCTGIDAAARKLGSIERTGPANANLRVAFGLPFTVRVIVTMILRAQKVLRNRKVDVHVFEHEKEAWAFFETEREKIRKELGLKKSL
jgi:hypothetical protein